MFRPTNFKSAVVIFVFFLIPFVQGDQCSIGVEPTYSFVETLCNNGTFLNNSIVTLTFDPTSITECTQVNSSEFSAFLFQESILSQIAIGQFMTIGTPPYFSVLNSHNTAIGTLIGHGVQLSTNATISQPVRVCLHASALEGGIYEYDRVYPFSVYDFALATDSFQDLVPLDLEATFNNETVCAEVMLNEKNQTFYPMKRLNNWKTAKKTTAGQTDLSLTYALAALFAVVALIAGFNFAMVAFRLVVMRAPPILTDFVVLFVFLFLSIRAIHLFMVAAEVSAKSVEFTLAVLPTFFYFTAFSLIAAFWAVTVKGELQIDPSKYIHLIKVVLVCLNVFLFSIFLILALCYHFLVVAQECSDRRPPKAKLGVSVAYSVTVAALSLFIGIAFNYFGKKLVRKLGMSAQSRKLQKQVSSTSSVLSSCFLLHCVFIILESLMAVPSVIFGFVGLITTELLPAASFLAANSSLHALRSTSMSYHSNNKSGGGGASRPEKESKLESKRTSV